MVEGIAMEEHGFFEWRCFGGEVTGLLDFCIYNRSGFSVFPVEVE
jgi:hypothetical protein